MTYKWKSGVRYGVDAQTAGEQCEELAKAGNLSAQSLVDVNTPEDAPLHSAFNWNDADAANEYRKEQARHIIRSIIIVPEQQEQEPVRAFFHIEAAKEPEYQEINVILRNQDSTDALLQEAYRDAKAFAQKYATLRKIAGEKMAAVFAAIDGLIEAEA